MNHLIRFPVPVFLILGTVAGCGSGNPLSYTNVKGTVTLNGQPLEKGEITFAVVGRPPTFINIVDGKFSGQAVVGSNTIAVSAKKKTGVPPKLSKQAQGQINAYKQKSRAEGGADPQVNFESTPVESIPKEWNSASKQVRVVEAGAANNFEFDIRAPSKN
jgi:hypothetical protein